MAAKLSWNRCLLSLVNIQGTSVSSLGPREVSVVERNRLPVLMLIPVLCLSLSATAVQKQGKASPQANSSGVYDQEIIRQILELEREARDASVHRDAAFAERTLADDYVAITPLGQVITKADTVAARRSGQLRYDSIDVSDMVVRVYGNTAVVTARAEGSKRQGPGRRVQWTLPFHSSLDSPQRPLANGQLPGDCDEVDP